MKKHNPFDGDRAATDYNKSSLQKECRSIICAFNLGQSDFNKGLPYNNKFNKKTSRYKYIAYRNGYKGK